MPSEKIINSLTFRGSEYKFINNDLLFDEYSESLRDRWEELEEKHIKKIDQTVLEGYESRIELLNVAINSFNGSADKTTQKRKSDLVKRRDDETEKMNSDLEVKSIRRMIKKKRERAVEELIKDTTFLKEVFSKILEGDKDKLELEPYDYDSIIFISQALNLFFSLSPLNKMKLPK